MIIEIIKCNSTIALSAGAAPVHRLQGCIGAAPGGFITIVD